MGIKVKSLDHAILDMSLQGTLAAGLHKIVTIAPFTGYLVGLIVKAQDAGTGTTATKLDVNKNGTTIFSASTTQISVASTTGAVSIGALTTDPHPLAAGDVLAIDIDAVPTNPINLGVAFVISKRPANFVLLTNLDDAI